MYIPLLDFKQTVSKRSEEYKCGLGEANCLCRLKIYKVNRKGGTCSALIISVFCGLRVFRSERKHLMFKFVTF